ncbi:MAG: hypothetical protein D6781_13480 [Verrucomicrobia bacterium]|nr:MAG: hypothetical protein D6781_13480 [Verrucomicrobiota bacterium]
MRPFLRSSLLAFSALALTLAFALCAAARAAIVLKHRGTPIIENAPTATFDGASDYLEATSSGPTGLADSKVFTLAFWLNMGAGTDNGSYGIFYAKTSGGSLRFRVMRQTVNDIQVIAYNNSNGAILSMTAGSFGENDGWVHFAMRVDLSDSGKREVRVDGQVSAATWSIYTDDTIDFVSTSAVYQIGAYNGANRLNGSLALFFLDDIYVDDLLVFYDPATSKPRDLGSIGTNAPFYLSLEGSGDTWARNSGAGPDFTVTGALGSTTSP